MRTLSEHPSVPLLGWLGTVAILASCSGDAPTSATEDLPSLNQASTAGYSVCHRTGAAGTIIQVSASDLARHQRHGDYLSTLFVSHRSDQPQDAAHFRHIGDALTAARDGRLARGELQSAACRITIDVAAGTFRGTDDFANTDRSLEHFPFVVDVPDITLHGALEMRLDANGRAIGTSVTQQRTTLLPIAPLSDAGGSGLILIIADPSASSGNGLTLEGFALRSGRLPGADVVGFGVLSFQASGLTLRGNRLEGFVETIDLQGSSAVVESNHISEGGQCDLCIAGPGVYRVAGNTVLAGGTHGIFTSPAINTEPVGPGPSEIFADIINNEVRDHRQQPISAGIRVGAVGLGAPDVPGSSHIRIRDNLLVNNNFGLMIDALFPQPDTRLKGDIEVTTSGNVVRRSCQADLLVAFARHTTALGVTSGAYLLNSTYRLTLDDLPFSQAWFSNPPGLGNTLRVNGHTIGHTTRQFFDETSCPGTPGMPARIARAE